MACHDVTDSHGNVLGIACTRGLPPLTETELTLIAEEWSRPEPEPEQDTLTLDFSHASFTRPERKADRQARAHRQDVAARAR